MKYKINVKGVVNTYPANMLHIKVRMPLMLYAIKTIEGDFLFAGRSPQMKDTLIKKIPT